MGDPTHNCTCEKPRHGEEYPPITAGGSRAYFECQKCNGLIIEKDQTDGTVLTALHCDDDGSIDFVWPPDTHRISKALGMKPGDVLRIRISPLNEGR